jgi:formate dehydrogenase major subunit
LAGDKPFILHADGMGWIWVPVGLADGPLPAHYEPFESPVRNPMYPRTQSNPVALKKEREGTEYAASPDERFPFVLTTYRITEHHTAGGNVANAFLTWRNSNRNYFVRFRSNWPRSWAFSRANG